MNIDEFWELIENIDQDVLNIIDNQELSFTDEERAIELLIKKLSELSPTKIEEFEENLYKVLHAIDGEIYANNAGKNGTSDDGFLYCRCYVVARGKKYYEKVLEHPTEMPKSINQWLESLLYVSAEAWSNVTGNDPEEWDFFPSVSNEKETNTKKTNKKICGVRIYCYYFIKDFNGYIGRYSRLFSALLKNENIFTPDYEEIYFYIGETLDNAKQNPAIQQSWHKNTYCELDLKKYNVSSEEEQAKMLFNSLKRGLLLITKMDHLNKEKIYKVLKDIEDNGFEAELTYMSKSKNNITASIVFKGAKKKPDRTDRTTYYLILQDKKSDRIGKVKINDFFYWSAADSLGQLKIKKETIEIVGKNGYSAETSRKRNNLPDSYIFDIEKILNDTKTRKI